ncbi:MAG: DUF1844 domain-containing protein [Acidobacteriota bacterium]|jgi:hypothetical protein|nr:DUF1844 domain-containing protein [Acidobacteriota bacterium]
MAEEQSEFKVTDRRGFAEDGTPKPVVEEPAKNENPAADASRPGKESGDERPSIDFPSYILSYYTQGMVLLGEIPNPYTNKKEEDIESSRNIIDILALLEEKTKGNLSAEESKLLESVLYELRMKFMGKTSRIKL